MPFHVPVHAPACICPVPGPTAIRLPSILWTHCKPELHHPAGCLAPAPGTRLQSQQHFHLGHHMLLGLRCPVGSLRRCIQASSVAQPNLAGCPLSRWPTEPGHVAEGRAHNRQACLGSTSGSPSTFPGALQRHSDCLALYHRRGPGPPRSATARARVSTAWLQHRPGSAVTRAPQGRQWLKLRPSVSMAQAPLLRSSECLAHIPCLAAPSTAKCSD